MVVSVALLIKDLVENDEKRGPQLLVSAASLWATNVLVFTLWYWRLDAGGPHARDKRLEHTDGSFLFPQMTMPPETKRADRDNELGLQTFLTTSSLPSTRVPRSHRPTSLSSPAGQRS